MLNAFKIALRLNHLNTSVERHTQKNMLIHFDYCKELQQKAVKKALKRKKSS